MCDKIVAISDDMKTKLIEQSVPAEKISVIVNWFDDKSVHKVEWEDNRFVKKYNLSKNTFYIQYAGTMGYVFDYKMVLNVAEKLVDYKDIEIQMIGMGSQKEAFLKEALNKGLSNIKFLPLEPQEMVSDVYSACSVCLIPLKQGIIGNSVPSKAGLLMECKKAIVTSSDESSFYNRMINDNHLGFAKSTNDVGGIVESILYLKNHPDENIKMGENGYKYGHFLYSRSQNIELYLKLFYSVVRPSKQ